MAEDVMAKIIGGIVSETGPVSAEELCFSETDCAPAEFSKENFHEIVPVTDPETSIVFIDGGNAEIFSSPDRCVNFIRVFHTIYKDNARHSCSADEFYTLAKTMLVENKVVFSADLFVDNTRMLTGSFFNESLKFDPLDPMFTERNSRMTISRVPGMTRRIAELSTALILASRSRPKDIVVIDGDLCPKTREEKKLIQAIQDTAEKRSVHVCGLAKTSDLLTSKGRSVPAMLSSIAPEGCWFYSPAGRRGSTTISFAKLHLKSSYIFKIETLGNIGNSKPCDVLDLLVPLLASNSTDAVFVGYPYGLIEADRFARVSNREREMLRTTFMAKAGNDWRALESSEASLNAHSVLDSI